jgi:hypothetical protein
VLLQLVPTSDSSLARSITSPSMLRWAISFSFPSVGGGSVGSILLFSGEGSGTGVTWLAVGLAWSAGGVSGSAGGVPQSEGGVSWSAGGDP